MKLAEFVTHLQGVKPTARGYTARCPAHDDQHNSLSIAEGADGRILLNDFAGCKPEAIVKELGFTMADLYEEKDSRSRRRERGLPPKSDATVQGVPGCTLAEYAKVKCLPLSFLQTLRLKDTQWSKIPTIRIPYLNENGVEIAVRFRTALHKEVDGSDNRFRWKSGSKTQPYGLWRLQQDQTYLIVVEGESDCHTLWFHGFQALGIPGADCWRAEWESYLQEFEALYIVIEPDCGGKAVYEWVGKLKVRDRVRLIRLEEHKDPSGLYVHDPEDFKAQWEKAMEQAQSWSDQQTHLARQSREDLYLHCKYLASDPNILQRFGEAVVGCGLVGEEGIAKLLYLAVISRVFPKPISMAVKGPSSGGKSFTVATVLRFFPQSAYYELTGMTDHALVYMEEPLRHRFLVLYENNGIQGDNGSYFIRSLLSEHRIRYETVESVKGELRSRLIEKEGPTGLITTTTAIALHPENETRLLSVTVTDTPEQTKAILEKTAEETQAMVDLGSWVALQEWVALGPKEVTIPYATKLARLIPPVATRLRRDFSLLLNLIKAHAVLHQANRDRDDRGRIVATVSDYADVRTLVAEYFSEGIEATVSSEVRETVEAVKILMDEYSEGVPSKQVEQRLKLDKSTVNRRVRQARDRGFLVNLEGKKRPMRLVVGDPLPVDLSILPDPQLLQEEACCAVASKTEGDASSPSLWEKEREQFEL